LTEKKSTKDPKKEYNIGIDVKPPKDTCEDKHCPFHGTISLRGRVFEGTVVRAKIPRMALVEWGWKRHVPKYERYEKKRTKVIVHNPPCMNVEVGDCVKIMETRKISKTKNFVIIENESS